MDENKYPVLGIGSMLTVDGADYMIVSWQRTVSSQGASVNIAAFEPVLALERQMQERQSRKAIELAVNIAETAMRHTDPGCPDYRGDGPKGD